MAVSTFSNEGIHTIKVQGHFNYTLQAKFREAYESVQDNCHFIVDFVETHAIDYSAVGMLLLLRDHSVNRSKTAPKVKLINCSEELHQIFNMLNFHDLFDLHSSTKAVAA